MSLIGNDIYGKRIQQLFSEIGVDTSMLINWDRPTITKTRFLAENNQQLLRLDVEESDPIQAEEVSLILNALTKEIDNYDLIVLSDYLKGLLTTELVQGIIGMANEREIKVLVDVKDPNCFKYKGAWLLKPNRKELNILTNMPVSTREEIIRAANYLLDNAECEFVLTTCGSKGMILVGHDTVFQLDTSSKSVYDVTGAGDTTIAYLAASIANGLNIKDAMRVANYAAGIQVGKLGTSAVYLHEVEEKLALKGNKEKQIFHLNEREELCHLIDQWKENNEIIVTTNGCFDILHKGHISLLETAKSYGNHLIVLLNSDSSVKRLKGNNRPINSEEDRALVIAALNCVDAVAIFDPEHDKEIISPNELEELKCRYENIVDEAPVGIIKQIKPDVHVKGGDYTIDQVPEAVFASRFESVPFVQGYSTTKSIEKAKKNS